MGAVGTMAISFDDPNSILVFDKDNRNYQSGDTLHMLVTEQGWAPRKVFVVNRGTEQSQISVQFQGAQNLMLAAIASLLLVTSYMF